MIPPPSFRVALPPSPCFSDIAIPVYFSAWWLKSIEWSLSGVAAAFRGVAIVGMLAENEALFDQRAIGQDI